MFSISRNFDISSAKDDTYLIGCLDEPDIFIAAAEQGQRVLHPLDINDLFDHPSTSIMPQEQNPKVLIIIPRLQTKNYEFVIKNYNNFRDGFQNSLFIPTMQWRESPDFPQLGSSGEDFNLFADFALTEIACLKQKDVAGNLSGKGSLQNAPFREHFRLQLFQLGERQIFGLLLAD